MAGTGRTRAAGNASYRLENADGRNGVVVRFRRVCDIEALRAETAVRATSGHRRTAPRTAAEHSKDDLTRQCSSSVPDLVIPPAFALPHTG
jgi:hypothetical protein